MATRIRAILEATDLASPTFLRAGNALRALGGIAAAVGAVQLGRVLVKGLADAVRASAEAETQESELAAALVRTGQASGGTFEALKRQATALQSVTTASDDTIVGLQALFIRMGSGTDKATELSEAALDLARVFKTDAESAARALAKAVGGSTGALGKLGIQLDAADVKARGATAVLEQLAKAGFGGAARAAAETFEGRLAQLNNQINNVQEAIGGPLREVLTAVFHNLLTPIFSDIEGGIVGVESFRVVVIDLAIALARMGRLLEPIALGVFKMGTAIAAIGLAKFHIDVQLAGSLLERLGVTAEEGASRFDPLIAALEELRKGQKALADEPFTAPVSGLDALKEKLEEIGIALPDIEGKSRAVTEALQLLATADPLLPAVESQAILHALNEMALKLHEEGGIVHGWSRATVGVLELSSAVNELVEGGAAGLNTELAKSNKEIISLGSQIQLSLGRVGVQAALRFGSALVDAAFTGKLAFKDFMQSLLRDIAEAIVQALILKAILSFGLFSSGGVVPGARGGKIAGAQHGRLIGGPKLPGDRVLIAAQPGEAVLPRELTDYIISGGARAAPQVVVMQVSTDIPLFFERVNRGVREGAVRVVASETVTSRTVR